MPRMSRVRWPGVCLLCLLAIDTFASGRNLAGDTDLEPDTHILGNFQDPGSGRLVGWLGETHHVSSHRLANLDTDMIHLKNGVSYPYKKLNNGVKMPQIGYGTCLGDGTYDGVKAALAAGYRHIDSAQAREWYREDMVGNAIKDSGVPREEIFITSKLHPRHLGYNRTLEQFYVSLEELHTFYVDLFMLHYPNCWGNLCGGKQPEGTWKDSYRALEKLQKDRKIRAIGMSNVDVNLMKELVEFAEVKPQVVQVYSDPLRPNTEMQTFCAEHGIQFEAYSSLGTQWFWQLHRNPVLEHPVINAIGQELGKSAAQVVLRWAIHHDQVVIPKSSNPARIAENLDAMSVQLTEDHIAQLDALGGTQP